MSEQNEQAPPQETPMTPDMTTLYTIPPLEFRQVAADMWQAPVLDGMYEIWIAGGVWRWVLYQQNRTQQLHQFTDRITCDSLAHGKQLCNEHWHERMAACLKPWNTSKPHAVDEFYEQETSDETER